LISRTNLKCLEKKDSIAVLFYFETGRWGGGEVERWGGGEEERRREV